MRIERKWLTLFSLAVMWFAFPFTIFADEIELTGDSVNIRSGPGTNFDVIGSGNSGDTYELLEEQGDWMRIQFNEEDGWVTSSFTKMAEAEKEEEKEDEKVTETSTSPVETITIPFDNTHIRSAPSTEGEIVGFAEKGDTFKVIGDQEDWLEVSNDDLSGFVSKRIIKKSPSSSTSSSVFKNKTIVIDAGHGGRDVGAIGSAEVLEKDVTFLTAQELASELTMLGAEVLQTRPEDEYISLSSRVSYANTMETDAFISIHYNSIPEHPDVTGIGTYFYKGKNEVLASYIQSELVKETEATDRGVTHGNFLVLRQSLQPSALLELGFLSNPDKESLLGTVAYQKKLVSGIVNGLGKYFANE
ncbi:N-acetylmuramoyl-L-alanine amidase LytC precursor [Oceanobacillus picturae]|uniref:N-acetylmuramoyl-L-alanine amidase LytC n=1 Tax=Oceanobacillus picturae TaxID=171693 RepID=A0A0U9H973_9BACI|nr:N-acetylmuramoyl-L-alanine amidase [Oceanobacillus picturae]GAQ16692.1 N-acetylmuramoyl-L-alanine amidase LytC precursor [Oceanobacillus picturae]